MDGTLWKRVMLSELSLWTVGDEKRVVVQSCSKDILGSGNQN